MLSVGSIGFHGCIRQMKQGMQLVNQGVRVHMACSFYPPTIYLDGFTSVHQYFALGTNPGEVSEVQLKETVRLLDREVDLFHVHNEPNWIFKVVKENTNKPVVFDIHDWTTLRDKPIEFEAEREKYALENADGFVVPNKGYLKRIREISKKPSILIYSKVPSFLYPQKPIVKKPGLVYEGGLKGKNKNEVYNFPYRNWAEFVKGTNLNHGNKIYLYSANGGDDFSDYKQENIEVIPTLPYRELLQCLSTHSVGLVGSPFPLPDFVDSMPNKLFEYIASGIPVIVINAPEAQKYAEENGLGIGIRDATEVQAALEKLTEHNIQRDRWGYSLDSEMPSLLSLYGDLCNVNQRVIAQTAS